MNRNLTRIAKTKCKELLLKHNQETDLENWSKINLIVLKKSSIENAGLGLFALVNFEENDIITEYKGKRINNEEVLKLTNTNNFYYIAQLNSTISIDGKRCKLKNKIGLGSMINDNRQEPNCQLYAVEKNKKLRLFVIAIRNIKSNEEFFLNYGQKYWEQYNCQ